MRNNTIGYFLIRVFFYLQEFQHNIQYYHGMFEGVL